MTDTDTEQQRRTDHEFRIAGLRVAADAHADDVWLACQLRDLADLLEIAEVEGRWTR